MGSFSIWHWLVVGIVLLLLFGKGRFSEMMGDVAKGIKSFKKGMTEDEEAAAQAQAAEQRRIDARAAEPTVIQPQSGDIPAEPAGPVATPAAAPASPGTEGGHR